MASVRKKGTYTAEDLVDEFILSKVSEHIDYSKLNIFSEKLDVCQIDYERHIGSPELSKEQQVYEVRKIFIYIILTFR